MYCLYLVKCPFYTHILPLCHIVKLLLKTLREQTLQGLIQRRQKLIDTLQNVTTCVCVCMCTLYDFLHSLWVCNTTQRSNLHEKSLKMEL